MVDISGDASWDVRHRWKEKLLRESLKSRQIGPLLTVIDIRESYESTGFVDDDLLEVKISEKEIRHRVNKIAWFMQEYCNDFDGGLRLVAVEHTEKFNEEDYLSTFMILFYNSRDRSFGSHYVDDPEEIYYGDIWWDVGFDEVAIRRPHGKTWTNPDRKKFIKMLSTCLEDAASIKPTIESDVYLVLSVERLDD